MTRIDVWRVPLGRQADPADRRLLSAAELDRAARFQAPSAVADAIRVRATLRRVLAAYSATPPDRLDLRVGPYGKPELSCGTPAFNLSHTDGLALIAITTAGTVGVDVESIDGDFDIHSLASRVLTPREAERVGADRRRFLRHWTAKESYLKCLGCGLTISPDTIELRIDADSKVVSGVGEIDLPTRHISHLRLGPRHVAAVASDRLPRRITVWEADSHPLHV